MFSPGRFKCKSKCSTDITPTPSEFDKDVILTAAEPNTNLATNKIEVSVDPGVSAKAKIRTRSARRALSPFNYNGGQVQNEFSTSYIFSIFYRADYENFQYILHNNVVYKIETADNINLENKVVEYQATKKGQDTNLSNFIER